MTKEQEDWLVAEVMHEDVRNGRTVSQKVCQKGSG